MATQVVPVPCTSVQGEQLSLTTAINAAGVPRGGRDGRQCVGVVMRCDANFRWQITPRIRAVFKVASGAYTDYTDAAQDRNTGTDVVLSSLPKLADGGYLLIGADFPFGGFRVDVDSANGTVGTMAVKYWKAAAGENPAAFADATPTDGTASGGAPFAQDGNVTFTPASDWEVTTINGRTLYWIQVSADAAMDSSTTLNEIALLSKDALRGFGYAAENITVPLGESAGAISALVASGTGTLDLTFMFNAIVGM